MRCQFSLLKNQPFRRTRSACYLAARIRRTIQCRGGYWELQSKDISEHEPLVTSKESTLDPARLFRAFGLTLAPKTHASIRLIRIGQFDIAVYSFRPHLNPIKGQILLLHGYILHSLCQAPLISHLAANGWKVISIDWPGHGLSSGKRASISDFSIYANILSSVIDTITPDIGTAPLHLIAHSTGCSAWIERIRSGLPDPFNKVILVSPLIRNAAWYASLTGLWLAKRIRWSLVPRIFRRSSHDPLYLNTIKTDPLAPWVLPIQWSQSLLEWQRKLHRTHPFERTVTVFQGTHDTVVDWKHGLRTIRRIFPRSSIIQCKGQRHDLLNESLPARTIVFEAIDRMLSPPIDPNSDSLIA